MSTGSNMGSTMGPSSDGAGIYEVFRDAIRAEVPVALATIIDAPDTGAVSDVRPRTGAVSDVRPRTGAVSDVRPRTGAVSDVRPRTGAVSDVRPRTGAVSDVRPRTGAVSDVRPRTGAKLLVRPDQLTLGTLGDPDLDRVVERDALGMLDAGISEVRHYGQHGEARQMDLSVFVECHARRPHMVIFGAVDFTRALASQAKLLGYRVTVCDAREVFATRRRFPMADEVVVDWPNRLLDRIGDELGPRDAVCVLTHDHKFDVPAIVGAFPTRVGYLGAMGSRTTHEKRTERLREAGVTDAELERVMAPIGLDIGGRTPEETAVSIVAEIIASHTGRQAPRLKDGQGRIH